jgi:hypothetical protein
VTLLLNVTVLRHLDQPSNHATNLIHALSSAAKLPFLGYSSVPYTDTEPHHSFFISFFFKYECIKNYFGILMGHNMARF